MYAPDDLVNPVLIHAFDHLRNKSGRVWHCRLPLAAMKGALYYAYRVDGPLPAGRFEWHAFDRDKVLLDPYARSVFFPPSLERLAAARPGSNAGSAPLGVLSFECEPAGRRAARHVRHEATTVIYELHIGGFTRHPSSGLSPQARGTYAGVIEKIPYLLDLGITVVELMPVFQFDASDGDYWGYGPISFFAPHNAYLSRLGTESQHAQFREMVDALHAAGLEAKSRHHHKHHGQPRAARLFQVFQLLHR